MTVESDEVQTSILDAPPSQARLACRKIHILDQVDSTNDWLWRLGKTDNIHAVACFANKQTAGRGRRGHHWQSLEGNIHLSLAWQDRGVWMEMPVTLILGTAILSSLVTNEHPGVGIKWPNDLYADNKKFGGILVERRLTSTGPFWVIGVGINLIPVEIKPSTEIPATNLETIQPGISTQKDHIIAKLISCITETCQRLDQKEIGNFSDNWKRYDLTYGQPITAHLSDKRLIQGIGNGIDAQGRLGLKTDNDTIYLESGEISLRLQPKIK